MLLSQVYIETKVYAKPAHGRGGDGAPRREEKRAGKRQRWRCCRRGRLLGTAPAMSRITQAAAPSLTFREPLQLYSARRPAVPAGGGIVGGCAPRLRLCACLGAHHRCARCRSGGRSFCRALKSPPGAFSLAPLCQPPPLRRGSGSAPAPRLRRGATPRSAQSLH